MEKVRDKGVENWTEWKNKNTLQILLSKPKKKSFKISQSNHKFIDTLEYFTFNISNKFNRKNWSNSSE